MELLLLTRRLNRPRLHERTGTAVVATAALLEVGRRRAAGRSNTSAGQQVAFRIRLGSCFTQPSFSYHIYRQEDLLLGGRPLMRTTIDKLGQLQGLIEDKK